MDLYSLPSLRWRIGVIVFTLAAITCGAEVLPTRDECESDGTVQRVTIVEKLRHLRSGETREWSDFSDQAEGRHLEVTFTGQANSSAWTLELRQQDVKQAWNVVLNGAPLGPLQLDENDMLTYLAVPAGTLKEGDNTLRIESKARAKDASDDIRVGEIFLLSTTRDAVLSEAWAEIEVVDADSKEHLPARITILRENGALQPTRASSNEHLAVRTGTIYTSDGVAKFGLPAGTYRIVAGRGFEYSLDTIDVMLAAGQTARHTLAIRREVPTTGYVACDTHVHTLTHSGHGDATVEERMLTLAGEGIELPIATDHNVHVDHERYAQQMRVRKYFTPVIGNEVTTPLGHFNIFPVTAGSAIPDFKSTDWPELLSGIERVPGAKVVILNHARDLHSGVRPFGPKLMNAATGQHFDGRALRVNAMEVVNSSATQTDGLLLFRDWMTQLNRGRMLTPVGSSDSHDVARHFVGQARTFIRCDDRDPGHIDIDQAVNNFLAGRVLVSYGLLTDITVNGKYHPGDLAPIPDDAVHVAVRVLGPHWTRASGVTLYANGQPIREATIPEGAALDAPAAAGVKWQGEWRLPRPKHDVHLVAIATGPGISKGHWKTARPYQPTSPDWIPHVFGATGAIWLDADRDGRKTSAIDDARQLVAAANGDLKKLLASLAEYDQAVVVQTAALYEVGRGSLQNIQRLIEASPPHVREGIRSYLDACREAERARSMGFSPCVPRAPTSLAGL